MNGTISAWAREMVELYESGATSQFVIHGNVDDRLLIPGPNERLGSLSEYLLEVLMGRFDVVLSYDLGNGIRVEKGGSVFATWPALKENPALPKTPRAAIETLTHYFRFCANLRRLNASSVQVGCLIKGADLLAPPLDGRVDYDLGALLTLIRDWANEQLLTGHSLATFLIAGNLSDLHPLLANNPRAARIGIPLPEPEQIHSALEIWQRQLPALAGALGPNAGSVAHQLSGATLGAIESVLRTKQHQRETLQPADVVKLKKQLIENDCRGLIEFLESARTLDDFHGQDSIKAWLRQDLILWSNNDSAALPKGYLLCGPVGTGKTHLVECLAGEAGVPVVKLKNFRDRWVGSTEGNLEKIFRLLHALGRCYVFVDEADQALGRRNAAANDSGVSGRVYSMLAEEMGNSANRGKFVWVLASSRPDLIEVDLKRPGRVDVKIPLLPTASPRESFDLISALARNRGMQIPPESYEQIASLMPVLLTPGAAEALVVKVYRQVRTEQRAAIDALRSCLTGYRHPVAPDVLAAQIQLALAEASDPAFVPEYFRTGAYAAAMSAPVN